MSNPTRVGAIYRKDLIDILRDRRTMLAMIVVPVVLYPLLLIGLMRLAQSEESKVHAQLFTIEVDDQQTQVYFQEVIDRIKSDLQQTEPNDDKLAGFRVVVGNTPGQALGDEVQLRASIQFVQGPDYLSSPRLNLHVNIIYNEVNVYSQTAMHELTDLFNRYSDLEARQSLRDILGRTLHRAATEADVDLVLQPIVVNSVSTATQRQRGGWALGQIVPIILVLMAITGAVYPAIDLTAGERERGTLETLMAAPVPILQLIVGKFLVVATIGMFVAILNVASVAATMHFSGLTKGIAGEVTEMPMELPASSLVIILFCMIPFTLLFSAILVAVCSFARTFKEAQNYVMPVIIGAMIPAMAVVMPSVRLEGIMLVVPVSNMVLLARELFLQTATGTMIIVVLLSTTLYAVAAVAVAAKLFGQEVVLFSDAGSYKTLFRRSLFPRLKRPTISQALLLAALLFPASFYTQFITAGASEDNFVHTLGIVAVIQFGLLFIFLPLVLSVYLKIDLTKTFRLHWPPKARIWLSVILLGASSWVIGHQFLLLQSEYIPLSEALVEEMKNIEQQLAAEPLWLVLLLLAVVPAVSEEWLFRGFYLSGIADSMKKWSSIIMVSVIFGVYHLMIDRIPMTALLGVLLGYICWQSRSLLPAIIVHAMHNAWVMVLIRYPSLSQQLGIPEGTDIGQSHLPANVQIAAAIMFVLGLVILMTIRDRGTSEFLDVKTEA
ncbi:MAG: ABC transporter permease subunit/CPBP intramembrane protease [Planctomycetota bacterium]|jgi:ABC-2 type transport system permease protein/sodium transport system permease protein